MGESSKEEQIEQLKSYLKNIMAKQDELQKILAVKHNKAAAARRLSACRAVVARHGAAQAPLRRRLNPARRPGRGRQ